MLLHSYEDIVDLGLPNLGPAALLTEVSVPPGLSWKSVGKQVIGNHGPTAL